VSDRSDRGFYVGYFALPPRHRRFLAVALPLAVLGMCVGAAGLATDQPAWGDGFWETGAAREFRGTLTLRPYPMLHADGGDERVSFLLVEMGKFGAADRFAGMPEVDGATVSIRGRELRRDGRRMIEIDPDPGGDGPAVAVLPADRPAVPVRSEDAGRPAAFIGQIVDSKCYLGAMKPGAGRGHKACATLCISGGIPPVLVVRDGDAPPSYLLLTNPAGDALSGSDLDAIKPMIAERIEIRGEPGRLGSWGTLAIDPADFD
jgi:hypothetical protein